MCLCIYNQLIFFVKLNKKWVVWKLIEESWTGIFLKVVNENLNVLYQISANASQF